jgi:GT2 family glycosyltransferase
LSQSLKPLEIIVIDNCSSDDSLTVTRSFGARWLPLETNLGLAPALNRGAAVALGDFLLFVNNDMRFDPRFVAALVAPFAKNSEIFATDGMQFSWDGSTREHMAARLTKIVPAQSSTELVPGLCFYQWAELRETPVFMASAACMMVRKATFAKLGGFDNRLPLGYEDVEISWRAWLERQVTLHVPDAICWHHVGSSTRSPEGARFAFRGVLKGRLLVATKLLPMRYIGRTWLVSALGLAKDLSRLRLRFAMSRIAVLLYMARQLATLLRERRQLFKNADISPDEHLSFLVGLANNADSLGVETPVAQIDQ